MAYITMANITGRIPGPFLIEALDDDADGQADAAVWDQIAADASGAVDQALGQRYSVPFTNPLPAVVVNAAQVFACEICYQRRGKTAEENPFTKQADAIREKLDRIARGEEPLTPTKQRANASVSVISERSKTASSSGSLSV